MGGYDPGVDNLQTFCALLEAANHLLETATPDLDARAKGLIEAESDLREELTGLKTETDALEKEVETSETQATGAAADLGAATHKALETRMPAVEGQVGETKDHSHQTLTQRAAALQTEFDELETRGFEPLDTLLTQEQSEFERWTNEADKALGSLVEGLEAATEETTKDIQQATADLTAANQATEDEHSNVANTLALELEEFDKNLPQDVEKQIGDASVSVPAWIHDEWGNSIKTNVNFAHNLVQAIVKDAMSAIQEENRQATDSVEAAGTALAQADTEFERAAADAESSEPEVASIADFRPRIETADEDVTEIRALMEAVSQP